MSGSSGSLCTTHRHQIQGQIINVKIQKVWVLISYRTLHTWLPVNLNATVKCRNCVLMWIIQVSISIINQFRQTRVHDLKENQVVEMLSSKLSSYGAQHKNILWSALYCSFFVYISSPQCNVQRCAGDAITEIIFLTRLKMNKRRHL